MMSLNSGSNVFARADRTDFSPWVAFFADTDSHAMIGMVHTTPGRLVDVRHARSAIPTLSEAPGHVSRLTAPRNVFSMISLAVCHMLAGDADQANALVGPVLDVSTTLRSIRLLDRMRPLKVEADHRPHIWVLRDTSSESRYSASRTRRADLMHRRPAPIRCRPDPVGSASRRHHHDGHFCRVALQ